MLFRSLNHLIQLPLRLLHAAASRLKATRSLLKADEVIALLSIIIFGTNPIGFENDARLTAEQSLAGLT